MKTQQLGQGASDRLRGTGWLLDRQRQPVDCERSRCYEKIGFVLREPDD
jgi:hypothetical protein